MTIETTIRLRRATLEDFQFWKDWKRRGQPYWERSLQTEEFDNKPCLLGPETSARELKEKIKLGMIFIPASDISD